MKIRLNWLGPMQHDSSELRQVRKEATVARNHGCSRVPGHLFLPQVRHLQVSWVGERRVIGILV